MKLNLGCGRDYRDFCLNVEHPSMKPYLKADVYWDIEDGLLNCVDIWNGFKHPGYDEIILHHILEHVKNLSFLWSDIYFILKTGGRLDIKVPHPKHMCAFSDPTHARFFTEECFTKFMMKKNMCEYEKYIYRLENMNLQNDGQLCMKLIKL